MGLLSRSRWVAVSAKPYTATAPFLKTDFKVVFGFVVWFVFFLSALISVAVESQGFCLHKQR